MRAMLRQSLVDGRGASHFSRHREALGARHYETTHRIGATPADPVELTMAPAPVSDANRAEIEVLAKKIFAALGAQAIDGEELLPLAPADLGGVSHEVGTLRMAGDGTGVVDANLAFLGYENLYACDNSVFPTSPAANPSLTLTALALRLAEHLASG